MSSSKEEAILTRAKTLRKTDPISAAKLLRSLKKRKQKAAKKNKNVQGDGGVIKDFGVPKIDESENEDVEVEYIVPELEQQRAEVVAFFKGDDTVAEAQEGSDGSSTESDGEDMEDDKKTEQDLMAEQLADVLARHESLCRREYLKVTEAEDPGLLDRDIDTDGDSEAAGERERLMMRFEEEVNATRNLEQPEKKKTKPPISKKKLKQLIRPAVSALKMKCARPDCVEVWDTTAPDPVTLVWLKAYRNTVPVPGHWNQKRKYLSGKRAIEKAPFRLPEYIEATKIGEIRAAILERESQKSLKQKQREKSRPKSNRMHVDFQTLHDAFFKYATKPPLTRFGDLYYEGKEREERTRNFKPGHLSSRLKEALGLVLSSTPPPWLLLMQRYGAPPSYANIKVPGLNTPLPSGAQWGFHAGGWGKPPTDQFGNPLYPGVFAEPHGPPEEIQQETAAPSYWGEFIETGSVSDESSDEDESEAEETAAPPELTEPRPPTDDTAVTLASLQTTQMGLNLIQAAPSGLLPIPASPLPGISSVPSAGIATPMSALGLGGLLTPSALLNAGLATPLSVTPSVPPSEFSSENIKEELKKHDEAARKAKEAAGQIEDVKTTEEATKKKKKRQFKF